MENLNQHNIKIYQATNRSITPSILEHLCYQEVGIYFILKQFGPQSYCDIEDRSSIGNKYFFIRCINTLVENGYIVEVPNE